MAICRPFTKLHGIISTTIYSISRQQYRQRWSRPLHREASFQFQQFCTFDSEHLSPSTDVNRSGKSITSRQWTTRKTLTTWKEPLSDQLFWVYSKLIEVFQSSHTSFNQRSFTLMPITIHQGRVKRDSLKKKSGQTGGRSIRSKQSGSRVVVKEHRI